MGIYLCLVVFPDIFDWFDCCVLFAIIVVCGVCFRGGGRVFCVSGFGVVVFEQKWCFVFFAYREKTLFVLVYQVFKRTFFSNVSLIDVINVIMRSNSS